MRSVGKCLTSSNWQEIRQLMIKLCKESKQLNAQLTWSMSMISKAGSSAGEMKHQKSLLSLMAVVRSIIPITKETWSSSMS